MRPFWEVQTMKFSIMKCNPSRNSFENYWPVKGRVNLKSWGGEVKSHASHSIYFSFFTPRDNLGGGPSGKDTPFLGGLTPLESFVSNNVKHFTLFSYKHTCPSSVLPFKEVFPSSGPACHLRLISCYFGDLKIFSREQMLPHNGDFPTIEPLFSGRRRLDDQTACH